MRIVMVDLEGRWLHAVTLPTQETLLRADDGAPRSDAVLERIDLAHGRVALRAPDGRYLARHLAHAREEVGPAGGALHLVEELTACAAFEELPLPDGAVALRGCDLRFLGVSPCGTVVGDRVADGSWERFRFVALPAPVAAVPCQPGAAVASALAVV